MVRSIAVVLAAALVAACAHRPAVPEPVRAAVAPKGSLRAGMNLGNNLFTTKNASGELQGVSVDIVQELGRRLDVPVTYVMYETPGQVADDAGNDKWDVAVLAIEQTRAATIAFSPPMTEIQATYLVRDGSRFQRIADVDTPGTRIAVNAKAGYDLYLTRALKSATLVRGKRLDETLALFQREKLDAVAGLRPQLLEHLHEVPGTHLLDGGFMTVNHGVGTPVARTAAASYVRTVVDDLVASGFIARSIERHKVQGLSPIRK